MGVQDWGAGLAGRGEQTGLLVAAATAPGTFEPSLLPRSPVDQGIVTGLAMTMSYILTVTTQDVLEGIASTFAERMPGASGESRQRAAVTLVDLAVIPASLAAMRALTRRPGEPVGAGHGSTGGVARWASPALVGPRLPSCSRAPDASTTHSTPGAGSPGSRWRCRRASPWVGRSTLGSSVGCPTSRRARRPPPPTPYARWRSASASPGPCPLSPSGSGKSPTSPGLRSADWLPGTDLFWKPVGHALCLGGLVFGGSVLWHRAMQKIEAGATEVEPVLNDETAHRFVGPTASGSTESLVPWDTLGREGRRHAFAYARPQPRHRAPGRGCPTCRSRRSWASRPRPPRSRSTWGSTARRRRRSGSTWRWPRWTARVRGTARSSCWSPRPAPGT